MPPRKKQAIQVFNKVGSSGDVYALIVASQAVVVARHGAKSGDGLAKSLHLGIAEAALAQDHGG